MNVNGYEHEGNFEVKKNLLCLGVGETKSFKTIWKWSIDFSEYQSGWGGGGGEKKRNVINFTFIQFFKKNQLLQVCQIYYSNVKL